MSTGYRPPSREPKGAWALHLHAFRKEHAWSQTRAFDEWGEGLGFGSRSRSAYIAIDMGDRQPTAAEAAYLVSVVGEPSEAAAEPVQATQPPDSLAAAIQALAGELRAWRSEERQRLGDLEATVRRLVGERLTAGESAGSPVRSAPQETTG